MPIEFENLTQKPIFLRLNSGRTLHLAPGLRSPQIDEFEWQTNAKVKKLEDLRAIALHPVDPASQTATTAKATTPKNKSSKPSKTTANSTDTNS